MNNQKKIIKNIIPKNQKFLLELPSRSSTKNLSNNVKNTEYTSPTSIWNNSIYSFNQNYIKNIPTVNNNINKMIKSFFTLNALDNNVKGKKSRLIQRRYKRLSLNRIFISKSEIKHSNNTVNITLYLFNKKKRSLMLRLKKLYNKLSLNLATKNRSWEKKNNFENLLSNTSRKNTLKTFNLLNTSNKPKFKVIKRDLNLNTPNLYMSKYNTNNASKLSKKTIATNYGYMPIKYKAKNLNNYVSKFIKNKNIFSFKNKLLYYNRLNYLTKYNILKFIHSLKLKQTNYNDLKKLFVYTNQYKLYNNNTVNLLINSINDKGLDKKSPFLTNKILSWTLIKRNKNFNLKNINSSISKLKSVHKLFALYNNLNIGVNLENKPYIIQMYNKKLLLNIYKILKKSYKQNNQKNLLSVLPNKRKINLNSMHKPIINNNNKTKPNLSSLKKSNNSNKQLLKNRNAIILMKKLNRIDIFFKRYKSVFLNTKQTSITKSIVIGSLSSYKGNIDQLSSTRNSDNINYINHETNFIHHIINDYKMSFIKDFLEKEFIYITYLKLLSYNNALFKNWLLFPLKNLIAKTYNKRIVLNLINLKYIHLNSDILTQTVNIRLRNFRKNRVVDVLKKAVKVVFISKVNNYACDEHSNIHKYIHNYYDKFKYLKLDIFKELGFINNDKFKYNDTNVEKSVDNITQSNIHKPYIIKNLNHIQTSTINFIKFKSVFGVRLEAAGRLTKRSTASRALFKFRYKGTLKNNPTINKSLSTTIVRNHEISNIQYTKISSKTRNGAFGLKGWINSN